MNRVGAPDIASSPFVTYPAQLELTSLPASERADADPVCAARAAIASKAIEPEKRRRSMS